MSTGDYKGESIHPSINLSSAIKASSMGEDQRKLNLKRIRRSPISFLYLFLFSLPSNLNFSQITNEFYF